MVINARNHSDGIATVTKGQKPWMVDLVSLYRVYHDKDTIPGLVNNYMYNERVETKTIQVANIRLVVPDSFERNMVADLKEMYRSDV